MTRMPDSASRYPSATRRRSSRPRSTPSPVVPQANTPSAPWDSRKAAYGAMAALSTATPPSVSGVTAATIRGRRWRSVNMRANATVIGVLTVRAIGDEELDWFVGLDPGSPEVGDTVRGLWNDGSGAPDWT